MVEQVRYTNAGQSPLLRQLNFSAPDIRSLQQSRDTFRL